MIVRMAGNQLRDKTNQVLFSRINYERDSILVEKIPLLNFDLGRNCLFKNDDGECYLPSAMSFDVQAIHFQLYMESERPGLLAYLLGSSDLELKLGEKRPWTDVITSPTNENIYNGKNIQTCFHSFEFEHRDDGTCDCIKIYPKQYFQLYWRRNEKIKLESSIFNMQIVLQGTMYSPIP